MKPFLLLLVFLPFYLFGQTHISGTVVDTESNNPVTNATVYLDGTTKGTTTDKDGNFTLKNSSYPCQLIISHVSYDVKAIPLANFHDSNLTISLMPRLVKMSEFRVMDKNERVKNINTFRKWFLGSDYWGENAEIVNDSILFFEFRTDSIKQAIDESELKTEDAQEGVLRDVFSVKADGPLMIRLPMLGYNLRVDLINFTYTENYVDNTSIGMFIGFYHFSPFERMSNRDKRVFKNNRRRAYYHSRQHFLHSLIEGRLAENGYEIKGFVQQENGLSMLTEITIDTCIHWEKGLYKICGLKDQVIHIKYAENWNGKPLDLTRRYPDKSYRSRAHFTGDTVNVYTSGNTPGQKLMFSGYISQKKTGAFLPEDYSPDDEL